MAAERIAAAGRPGGPAVLHLSTPRTWRGGEQQVAWLYEELDRLGVAQALACPEGSALHRHGAARGWRLLPLRRRASIDPLYARAVARAARAVGAELVHAHDAHAHTGAALAAALFRLEAPLVVSRRVAVAPGTGPFSRWKWGLPGLRRILCVSRAVERAVTSAAGGTSRLRVVHDGVDLGRFGGERPDGRLRGELAVPAGVPLVGLVGTLGPDKDPLAFLAVAGRLLARGVEARFVLVGEGPLRRAVEARARALGLGGRVHLLGFRADVASLLPELDLLVSTSATEGLCSTLLDAAACGVPVVATSVGGVPEAVLHGETGLLAPAGDADGLAAAAARLLGDAALRARLVAAATRRVREFSSARMARQTLAAYQEAVAEGRADRGAARPPDPR